jgi:hypothetical protein
LNDQERDPDNLSNPQHPDHDLSEWAGSFERPAPPKPWFVRRWALLVVAVLVISSLLLPYIARV